MTRSLSSGEISFLAPYFGQCVHHECACANNTQVRKPNHVEEGDPRRDGCPNSRHLFQPNYVRVWTHKFGQRLSIACGVDFVLFKPLYVKITFIAIFLIFHHMSHSKLSAKTASEDCILFFFKSHSLHDKVLGLLDLDNYQYSLQGTSTSQ